MRSASATSPAGGFPPRRRGAPRLDRENALGWRDVALDGLNCFLRCVESVLRWEGLSRDQVAFALAGPVDLLRRERNGSTYDCFTVEWEIARDGSEHWDRFTATLRAGTPLILMPDRFHWPGDELAGRHHFHDHAVLAVKTERGMLHVLDIDASPAHGHAHALAITPALRRACTRWGSVRRVDRPPAANPSALWERLSRPSLELLARDLVELRSLAARWRARGLDELRARALHVAVLGDFQPVLFLFAEAVVRDEDADLADIAEAALLAARRAKSLGLLLIALHRQSQGEAYAFALPAFELFVDGVEALHASLEARLGDAGAPPAESDGALERRLGGLAEYCFADPPPALSGS
jgi:hypothetical protein